MRISEWPRIIPTAAGGAGQETAPSRGRCAGTTLDLLSTVDSVEASVGPAFAATAVMPYPVRATVETPRGHNRPTTLFRVVLALPHTILAGPMVWFYQSGSLGLLGAAAYFLAIVNGISLVVFERAIPGARDVALFYLRWRTRALAYTALLTDAYPPFGDGPYPAAIAVTEPSGPRDRLTIALRPIWVLPHVVVLAFVLGAWVVTSVIAWFAILFTGKMPASLFSFGAGAMQWSLRVEAYLLLLVDEYPPFSLWP